MMPIGEHSWSNRSLNAGGMARGFRARYLKRVETPVRHRPASGLKMFPAPPVPSECVEPWTPRVTIFKTIVEVLRT